MTNVTLRTVADLGLPVRAVNALWWLAPHGCDFPAMPVVDLRALLVTRAGEDERRVYSMLRKTRNIGRLTAKQWCEALCFPVPTTGPRHCPTCTCWRHDGADAPRNWRGPR